MDLDPGVSVEKLLDLSGLVSAAVVHDEMEGQVGINGAFDLTKKGQELSAAMAPRDPAHDLAAGNVEGRIETGRSVTFVVVRPTLNLAWPKLQQRLCAVQRLN